MSDTESTQPTPSENAATGAASSQPPTWIPVPPQPVKRRGIPARWRLATAALGAFVVGCGAAAGTTALVIDHGSSSDTESSAQSAFSQALQTYEQGLSSGSGSSGSYSDGSGSTYGSGSGSSAGQFPQFGDFSQYGGYGQGSSGSSSGATGATADTASEATAAQSKGVVEITSTLNNGTAAGTGMILTSNGVVVTNHHVVAGATSVKVTDVSTGKTYDATYIGGDATTDVAVLQLTDASGLDPVTFADSAAAAGDEITSVGDAGGDGGSLTASPGTVAALDQNITVQDDDGGTSELSNLIELNAYIVAGDSGGAVFDASGDVVGMNVAASSGGTSVVGYAIPAATVESLVQEIVSGTTSSQITYGYTGYLGVGLSSTSTQATIAEVVTGEAAAKAGIEVGDVITSFNGTTVTSASQLQELVAATSAGDKVKVGWETSQGVSDSATVTLGSGGIA